MSDLVFKKLTLVDFKTFSGTHEINLDQGPALIYITGQNKVAPELGANGVGKTTLFDALTWVLWGRTGRDNRPADAVVPWGSKAATVVSLEFECRGRHYELHRQRNPNRLLLDRQDTEHQQEIQQDEVPKLLGMSEEMFRRTLVLGQFGTLFLDLKPEAQAQMFTEALGLDVWLKAVELAGHGAKVADRDAAQAQANLDATKRMLVTLASDLDLAVEQSSTFEQDRAARMRKAEQGMERMEADLAQLGKGPAKPPVPAMAPSCTNGVMAITADLRVAERELDNLQCEGKTLAAQLEALNKPKAKRICPECQQEIQGGSLIEHRNKLVKKSLANKEAVLKQETLVHDLKTKAHKANQAQDQERKQYDKALAEYKPKLEAYEAYTKKVASIQGELRRQQDALRAAEQEENQAAAQVERLKARRKKLRAELLDLEEQFAKASEAREHAKFWQDGFREIRLSIIDQALLELEIASANHMAMLGLNDWGIKFDTERETQSGKVSYAFTVLLYPAGQDKPVRWESYSGGESQRVQLAVSFALSEVLLGRAGLRPNFESFDEPTRGLSAAGVSDLLDHLHDRAVELGRSVYFVDHRSLDKGAFDKTLMVTKTAKGSSFSWQ